MSSSKISTQGYALTLIAVGFIWLKSSYGKFLSGTFADSLPATLAKFSEKNPSLWYRDILELAAIPNSYILGPIILWGEFLTALLIVVSALYLFFKQRDKAAEIALIAGLAGGAIFNLNFLLAAGWMSPSTESINLLMLMIEIIGIVYGLRMLKSPAHSSEK